MNADNLKKMIKNKQIDIIDIPNGDTFLNQFRRSLRKQMSETSNNYATICAMPFLQHGVICLHDKYDNSFSIKNMIADVRHPLQQKQADIDIEILIHFNVDAHDEHAVVTLSFFINYFYDIKHVFTVDLQCKYDNLLSSKIVLADKKLIWDSDFTIVAFEDNSRQVSTERAHQVIDEQQDMIYMFFFIMSRLNALMERPADKRIDNKQGTSVQKISKAPEQETAATKAPGTSTHKKIKNVSSVHIINLNGIGITVQDSRIAKRIRSKKPERIATSWNVRGHFRHYKSGKTVYIKPYKKGTDHSKQVQKIYQA